MATFSLVKDDITTLQVDAIVNAANTTLLGGGGVDGAIHRAGGSQILEACKQIRQKLGGNISTGDAVTTIAGRLPAKYVIHTAGPVWRGGDYKEEELLESCYINALQQASKYNCQSVAFPNISTGVYGFPKDKAAPLAVQACKKYLNVNGNALKQIVFVCFDDENYTLYKQLLPD